MNYANDCSKTIFFHITVFHSASEVVLRKLLSSSSTAPCVIAVQLKTRSAVLPDERNFANLEITFIIGIIHYFVGVFFHLHNLYVLGAVTAEPVVVYISINYWQQKLDTLCRRFPTLNHKNAKTNSQHSFKHHEIFCDVKILLENFHQTEDLSAEKTFPVPEALSKKM